jgi:hypothetical protein
VIDEAWEYWEPDPEIMEVAFGAAAKHDAISGLSDGRQDNYGYRRGRLKGGCGKLTVEKALAFGRMWREGRTVPEMAERLGVSTYTVNGWRRHYGLDARPVGNHSRSHASRMTPEVATLFADLWFVGASLGEIGGVFGVTPEVASYWRMKFGLPPGLNGKRKRAEQVEARRSGMASQEGGR